MKIFHALVSYLAITALPLHPFAFASPLAAIDHDGDVTSSIQVVKTCQTVSESTQNHAGNTNSTLMKCVPGDSDTSDILEARQAEIAAYIPAAFIILSIVTTITFSIVWIESDDPVRGNDIEFPILFD